MSPRAGQSHISITPSVPFTAGEEVTLNLGRLIYTQGETATNVTVSLGDAVVNTPIDPTLGEPGYGEAGQASVTLSVPAELSGEQELLVTTDAGTEIGMLVMVTGAEEPVPEPQPEPGDEFWNIGSSALTGVFGAFAGLIGTLGLINWLDASALRQLYDQLQARINQFL